MGRRRYDDEYKERAVMDAVRRGIAPDMKAGE